MRFYHFFFPCIPLVNNQAKLSLLLHYSYRLSVCLEGISLSQPIMLFKRLFPFDEQSLNSSYSHISSITPSQSTTITNALTNVSLQSTGPLPSPITDLSLQFSNTQNEDAWLGIYEEHPGLHPSTDERVVELQADIHAKLAELMPNYSPQDVLVAAEALHAESDKIYFLEYLLEDLTNNGVSGSVFHDAIIELARIVAVSPLEQFTILPLIPIQIGNLYFSFTNSSLFMLLTLSLVLLLLHFVTKNGGGNLVPNAWQSLVELIYDFVLNLVNEQIGGLSGNVKQKFFPCILVTFTFLLFCNLQGMIPYSFTVTSHFLITLGLSFSIFIGITIVGFQRNGLHFLSFLLPAGVPLPLAPFLVLLELISYCFRALSLGIRLFANMMAGHSLVKILSGFAWTMLCMNDLLYFIGDLGPLFIVLALTGLELGVAILQAYVFTILICIYLNDAINLH
jgi:F-type H+-transporting ATPase subunit a